MLKISEVVLDNGDIELFFIDLMKREDFNLILDNFIALNGVKIISESEDAYSKLCLLSNGVFDFILAYSSDSFVWNYTYAVKKENHKLLKNLCENFAELIS